MPDRPLAEELLNPDDFDELAHLLHEFITAPTFYAKQRLVEGNARLLLSSVADSALAGLRLSYDGDSNVQEALDQHRRLLRRCREIGVRNAFLELRRLLGERPSASAAPGGELDEAGALALVDVIGEFVTAADWSDSRRVLDAHPELLSSGADAVFERLIRTHEARHELNVVRQLIVHRDLLRRCREVGSDAAFERMANPPHELDIIAENTIAVLTDRRVEWADWQEAVRQSRIRAAELGNGPMLSLLQAVSRLLAGEAPDAIKPDLDGPYAECWARILARL